MVVFAWWLDLVFLEVFSNLWFYERKKNSYAQWMNLLWGHMLYEDSGCIHVVQRQLALCWIGSSTECVNPSFLSVLQFFDLCLSVQTVKNNMTFVLLPSRTACHQTAGRCWMSWSMVWNQVSRFEDGKPAVHLHTGLGEHTLYSSSVVPMDRGPRVNYQLVITIFCFRGSSKEAPEVD